jgi:hypothetical protein
MPRSPSRDLSDRYTGKRGYFRTPDSIRRGKYVLAAMAFIGACVWAAVDVAKPAGAAYAHTHGPLANPHAAFDNKCEACHATHSADGLSLSAAFRPRDRWHDFTCEKCHSGPAHHASASEQARAFHDRCSHCHHDHLGRLNSLVRLSDADCTKCHADLGQWHDAAKSKAAAEGKPYQNSVTNFVTNHPEFRSLSLDKKPRTLKFSHAVHMNPGAAYTPGGKEAMTPARIRELSGDAAAARYAKPGQADTAPVQLDCASCHKLDPGAGTPEFDRLKAALEQFNEPTKSILPPRQPGAYFLPINFEQSCRACHPLRAPDGTVASGDSRFGVPGFDVPHRRQPAELGADLKAGYLKGLIAGKHPALQGPTGPGGKLDTPPAGDTRTLEDESTRLAGAAERLLLSADAGCAKCHTTTGTAGGKGRDALRVKRVPQRTVWMEHAKFNHASHRGVRCASCHPGTAGRPVSAVQASEPEPVQILGADSCRACHSPEKTKVKLPDGTEALGGGIRHNCTDCHNYHHGDLPLQGRGSPTFAPKDPRDLEGWLKGK